MHKDSLRELFAGSAMDGGFEMAKLEVRTATAEGVIA